MFNDTLVSRAWAIYAGPRAAIPLETRSNITSIHYKTFSYYMTKQCVIDNNYIGRMRQDDLGAESGVVIRIQNSFLF